MKQLNSQIRNINVLVIEDDEFIAMAYEDQLSEVEGIEFNLDVYSNIAEGIKAFDNSTYDVLLLDLNLPDSNQSETVQQIPRFSAKLPVIIMTSTSSELVALQTMNLGSQDFLQKGSLNKTLFVRSILYGIERHQLKSQLTEAIEKAESQRDVSDKLLLNILPEEIAKELKENGQAKARDFENVSILFTDFKDFTQQSAQLSAIELVNEINLCFKEFDSIVEKYRIEKIKTIGDAYMAVGGLPIQSPDSAYKTVKAAIEMQTFMIKRKNEKDALGKPSFEMRAGIHTGPIVAGIVGTKKFQYDIWGDSVNTASRMENNCEVGLVNISESTYNIVKDSVGLNFRSRGEIEVKGKGHMQMHYASFAS
ncbi:MAG: response regulator [Bacteroidia bacterium]